jgi:hypothetical protein
LQTDLGVLWLLPNHRANFKIDAPCHNRNAFFNKLGI